MEKAKRKNNLEIAQKRLTVLLLAILALSIFFFRFPLISAYTPYNSPIQFYSLVPLLSIPVSLLYARQINFKKRHLILLILCLLMFISMYLSLQPCYTRGLLTAYSIIENTPFAIWYTCGWWGPLF
jgi:hypothetical protein